MKYKLKAYSIWEFGKRVDEQGNPHQEDSMYPAHNQASEDDRLFILCDGMGGHEAGEVASATVCEAMSKSIFTSASDPEGAFSEETLQKAISDAYDALDEKDTSTSSKKMGTTMTLLKLYDRGCFVAHMGDSRIYHIRPGKGNGDTKVMFRTEDHSLVNDLVKIGELTPEEAKHSKQKNVITRAMQPHQERRCRAAIHHITDIQPGDYFYLCSDGMLENMEDNQLCYYFSAEAGDDNTKVERLKLATKENRDNHSAIIVHILEVTDPIAVPTPAPVLDLSNDPLMAQVHDMEPETQASSPTAASNEETPTDYDEQPHNQGPHRRFFVLLTLILILLVVVILLLLKIAAGPKNKEKHREAPNTEQVEQEHHSPQPHNNNNGSTANSETVASPEETAETVTPADNEEPAPQAHEEQEPNTAKIQQATQAAQANQQQQAAENSQNDENKEKPAKSTEDTVQEHLNSE
ncbi:MAG: protein phosphatase 2C domain-containing protein [Prevotellaceae bacterium]|nr:protein phosphatase 2C domain-containing protein [Prevotellaceae bacterium]